MKKDKSMEYKTVHNANLLIEKISIGINTKSDFQEFFSKAYEKLSKFNTPIKYEISVNIENNKKFTF